MNFELTVETFVLSWKELNQLNKENQPDSSRSNTTSWLLFVPSGPYVQFIWYILLGKSVIEGGRSEQKK